MDIEKEAEKYIEEYDVEYYISIEDFIMGAKWYKEMIESNQNKIKD
jgi:hypothetical protein